MTIPPRRPTLCTVSGAVIVEMMSAPTSNSSSRTHVACAGRLTSRSKARQGNPEVSLAIEEAGKVIPRTRFISGG
jgi:hypothetical protein